MPNVSRVTHRRPMLVLAWLASLALLVAACGPAATDATPTPADPTPSPADTPTPPGTADEDDDDGEPAAGTETVRISGFAFQPDQLTISVGTEVEFVNEDNVPHTATHGTDGAAEDDAAFNEGMDGGESATVTFDEAGTFNVTCALHPNMNMTITVEG